MTVWCPDVDPPTSWSWRGQQPIVSYVDRSSKDFSPMMVWCPGVDPPTSRVDHARTNVTDSKRAMLYQLSVRIYLTWAVFFFSRLGCTCLNHFIILIITQWLLISIVISPKGLNMRYFSLDWSWMSRHRLYSDSMLLMQQLLLYLRLSIIFWNDWHLCTPNFELLRILSWSFVDLFWLCVVQSCAVQTAEQEASFLDGGGGMVQSSAPTAFTCRMPFRILRKLHVAWNYSLTKFEVIYVYTNANFVRKRKACLLVGITVCWRQGLQLLYDRNWLLVLSSLETS